jgi:hypothetical protein
MLNWIFQGFYSGAKILDNSNNISAQQISIEGGLINLAAGLAKDNPFYVAVSPTGTEGILYVILAGDETNTPIPQPVFKGYNPILVKAVSVNVGNTAVDVYWGR